MINRETGLILLLQKIDQMMINNKELIVAIDGPCGSGKSSLASSLGKHYDVNIFHLDDFFLTPDLRTEERLKEPGGNVDYERFRQEIIQGLDIKKGFSYYRYNCKSDEMEKKEVYGRKPLTIIEGSYSLHPFLRAAYNLKIFITLEPELQRQRIISRNGEELAGRFFNEWIPLENFYFDAFSIRDEADIVLDGCTLGCQF